MALFALSCVGCCVSCGSRSAARSRSTRRAYRVRIAFPDAGQLADQADVRIAGVSVGKVLSKSLDPQGNRTIATIQLNDAFAPIHKDARAILREKNDPG